MKRVRKTKGGEFALASPNATEVAVKFAPTRRRRGSLRP